MNQTELIKQLAHSISCRGEDIKAEVLMNHAVENGFHETAFFSSSDGFFHRTYTKDVYGASCVETGWHEAFLLLQLSRPGLYDMLPEALFHQPELRPVGGVADMTERYKKNSILEKEARRFFQPLEHELFCMLMKLEKEELQLLDISKHTLLTRYLLSFWELPSSLQSHEAASFLLLLPYAHQVNGNIALMQSCLKALLQEEVTITRREPGYLSTGGEGNTGLGNHALGNDMVCGNTFLEDYPVLRYTIGPLKKSNITDYLPGGAKEQLIATFNNYFSPTGADTDIEILMDGKRKKSGLLGAATILGYSSVIN